MKYDYKQFCKAFGAQVKRLRQERGLTHRRMIVEFGFHINQVSRIEAGEGVSMQTMLKLCAALDMTVEEIMQGLSKKN